MARLQQPPREFSALDRLAQTRAEITDLIAPELAYPSASDAYAPDDPYDPLVPPIPPTASAHTSAQAHPAMHRAAHGQADRDAAAAWVDDRLPPSPRAQRAAAARAAARAGTAGVRQPAAAPGSIWRQLLRHGASVWWQRHPAYAAMSVAGSALSHVVIRKPYMTLGFAAGVGALVVLIRPWRLVSITGLVIAALKMSDLRGLFGSIRRGG